VANLVIDSAARDPPMAQMRTIDRILSQQTTAAELEPLSYNSEEYDDLDEPSEGQPGQHAGLHSAAGPVRTMKVGRQIFFARYQRTLVQSRSNS
jgi:hypothetical protein